MAGTTVGIIGAGQLGLMLATAADALGIPVSLIDVDPEAPGLRRSDGRHVADWASGITALADDVDVLTWDREDVAPDLLAGLPVTVPGLAALRVVGDRLHQKRLLDELEIPTATWRPVEGDQDIDLPGPWMLKARSGGFDGRGQQIVRELADWPAIRADWADRPTIVEELVPFDDEFAIQVTRSADGQVAVYPVVHTFQEDGQLSWALAPHGAAARLQDMAADVATRLVDHLAYIGTLAVECFRCGDRLVVNEIAARVHNSGHGTIEGCEVSQFANHMRAVAGRSVAEPAMVATTLMLNCIGSMPALEPFEGLAVHDYGKRPRENRKVGHLTLHAKGTTALDHVLAALPPAVRESYRLPASWSQTS